MAGRGKEKARGRGHHTVLLPPLAMSGAAPGLRSLASLIFPREALGVVLHKDSKWYQQWKDFRDNNVVFNRECSHLRELPDSRPVTDTYQVLPEGRAQDRRRPGSERISHSHRVAQRVSSGAQASGGLRGSTQYLSGGGLPPSGLSHHLGWSQCRCEAARCTRQPPPM